MLTLICREKKVDEKAFVSALAKDSFYLIVILCLLLVRRFVNNHHQQHHHHHRNNNQLCGKNSYTSALAASTEITYKRGYKHDKTTHVVKKNFE